MEEQRMIKKIGIIGAMEEEVEALRTKLQDPKKFQRASMDFYSGTLEGIEAVIVRSGIGKVNAGICTQILADVFQVDAVINTGIAGSLQAQIDIGDVVISTDTVQHDMDATGFGYEPGVIPRMETSFFEADKELVEKAAEACREAVPEIHVFTGRVVSGDQFVSDRAVKDRISSQFGGMCTEMEGAAIAQAAWLNQIPFVIIRAISDKADDSATMDYPTFEKEAIRHSVALVETFVKKIQE
jgi:adenosylhomocysteine nucleosidase